MKLLPTTYYRRPKAFSFPTRAGVIQFESHEGRHHDEIAGQWAIMKWPGQSWLEEHCPDGKARLGIGNGPWDEHGGWVEREGAWVYVLRKLGESCASLVLKSITWEGRCLYDYDGMRPMIQFIRDNDLSANRSSDEFRRDIAHVIDYLHCVVPEEAVINWALQGLDLWYAGRDCDPSNFQLGHFADLIEAGYARHAPRTAQGRWRFSWAEWYEMAIMAIDRQQADWKVAVEYIRDLPPEHTFETDRYDGKRVRAVFVSLQNRQTGPASRWCGYDLCVQAQLDAAGSLEGAQIFRNRKRLAGAIDIRPMAYQIKRLIAQRQGSQLPDEILGMTREQWLLQGYAHPWDRCFLFEADPSQEKELVPPGEAVFLRSLTARDIPIKGLIAQDELISIACDSLEYYQEDPYCLRIQA